MQDDRHPRGLGLGEAVGGAAGAGGVGVPPPPPPDQHIQTCWPNEAFARI